MGSQLYGTVTVEQGKNGSHTASRQERIREINGQAKIREVPLESSFRHAPQVVTNKHGRQTTVAGLLLAPVEPLGLVEIP